MKAKELIREMAIEFGDTPDWIDPESKRKIERGTHPYSGVGAFPREPGEGSYPPPSPSDPNAEPRAGGQIRNYAELLASDQYPKLVRKMAHYLGVRPNQLQQRYRHPGALVNMMMGALRSAMQWEQGHAEQLQDASIHIVLNLPEFEIAQAAYENDELRIKAHLGEVNPEGLQQEPQEPNEVQQQELQIAQVAQELDLEKQKRRMINMMIQGSALNKHHAYHQIADQINAINPQLLNTYGVLTSIGDFLYWVMPEMDMGGGDGGAMQGGKSRFYIDEEGIPTIDAQGIVFPVLIQELVKGMMEYLSHNEDDDPGTRSYVQGQVDTVPNEKWDIMKGPAVWRQFLRVLGAENQNLMPYVYREIIKLPPEQFNQTVQGILKGAPEARQWLRNLVTAIRGDLGESAGPGNSVVKKLIG